MYCSKCGAEINDDDVFCAKCGNKLKAQKSIKLTKKYIITLSVITFIIAGTIFNEYKVYFAIKEYKEAVSLVIQANLNDIDILEDKMADKCTDDGVRGKYGYSGQNVYFKQKACYKNAEKIADEKRKIYYQKLNEYKNLSYLEWRKIVILEKKKKNIFAKVYDAFSPHGISELELRKYLKLIENSPAVKNTASAQKMLYELTGDRLLSEYACYRNGRVYVDLSYPIYGGKRIVDFTCGSDGTRLITGFEMKDVRKAFEYVVKKQDKINHI